MCWLLSTSLTPSFLQAPGEGVGDKAEAVEAPVPRLWHPLGEDKTQTLTAAKQGVGRRQQGPCDGSWAGCWATLGSNPNSASA